VPVLEINSDITARKLSDQQIRTSLREKEVLLKEVHHRVKNNLQLIASLLSLQSEYSADSKALSMLDDMKTRVRSIAAIHEILYGSADLSRIDFAGYLNSIGRDLKSFYSGVAEKVKLTVKSEAVFLDITQAVPCGLIVNELLTNSFKYAFPGDRSGTIEVSFWCQIDKCILKLSDDGISLPKHVEPENAASMGLQLVTLLVQQLKGKLTVRRHGGTKYTIAFARKPV
jgi:two-component sensor histidine kinase